VPKLYIQFSLIHAIRHAHDVRFYFIILLMFGEQYKLVNSSLCSFLQFYVISSLLGPDILLSTLFTNILSLTSSSVGSELNYGHISYDQLKTI
jgi:hypothetical protein